MTLSAALFASQGVIPTLPMLNPQAGSFLRTRSITTSSALSQMKSQEVLGWSSNIMIGRLAPQRQARSGNTGH